MRIRIGVTLSFLLLGTTLASAQRVPTPEDPLAGFSGDTAYLRSSDNSFTLLPHGRLQVDGYLFKRDTADMPNDTVLLRRVRLELFGWIGSWVGFSLAGDFALGAPRAADPVPQSWIATTDNFVFLAPWENLAVFQLGQFDAPFTLENRTSDKYFDFMERSITVRAFGAPSNKEVGSMLHGMLPDKVAYYSLGLFNGDGQNFANSDSDFDFLGRAWVAPLALAHLPDWEEVTLGGSFWVGERGRNGLPFPAQATQGGLRFLENRFIMPPAMAGAAGTKMELHQRGDLAAYAFELDLPILHRAGVRFEYVHRNQDVAEVDGAAAAGGKLMELGHGTLNGFSLYGEAWFWILGDDRLIGRPGLQLPPRLRIRDAEAPRHGLMVAARIERLQETLTSDMPALDDPAVGKTEVTSFELGVNYWFSRRFRATFNYVLNRFGGNAKAVDDVKKVVGGGTEHELLTRLGIAL